MTCPVTESSSPEHSATTLRATRRGSRKTSPSSSRTLRTAGSPKVARRLSEGEADVALIPVAAAATIGDIDLLDLGIVARGNVRSVVVVSEQPDIDTLMLDASSRTSVVLARLELAARGIRPKTQARSPKEAIENVRGNVGAVVIGDPALEIEGKFPHVIDLGGSFVARTGHPFVFAAWAARVSDVQVAPVMTAAAPITPLRIMNERRSTPSGIAELVSSAGLNKSS